jgi:hypothetical protein
MISGDDIEAMIGMEYWQPQAKDNGWRPIETAPKNPEGHPYGPWILVWKKYDHGVYQVRWQYNKDGMPFFKGKGETDLIIPAATHWQPLPEPPKE